MALGVGIGRLGCFMNGCCFGLPTSLPWGVHFPAGSASTFLFHDAAIHPSQLYLSGAGFLVFFLLLAMDRTPRFDGRLFWLYIAIDAAFRFVIDFTRYYDATSAIGSFAGLGFNVNQILSAGLILAAAIMLSILSRRPASSDPGPAVADADGAEADTLPTP
jgi:phosphatidylglycerol:prolipoprotein diacylglycerol transferase